MSDASQSGWGIHAEMADLLLQLRLAGDQRVTEHPDNAAAIRHAHSQLMPLFDDVSAMSNLILRITLDFEHRNDATLSEAAWAAFSRQDVEFFFVLFRSALDHAAAFIVAAARTTDWKRITSFRELRTKCKDVETATKHLGSDWTHLVRSCDWFEEFRDWRDELTHKGALVLTFFDDKTIPFQVHKGNDRQVRIPELMCNENVADFQLFAALYLSYLYCLFEDMATIGRKYLLIGPCPKWAVRSGGGALEQWIDRLLAVSRSGGPPAPQLQP